VRDRVNDTAAPAAERGLHEPVFARAAEQPDAPALLWGEAGCLTYGALADLALRLAAELRARGVGPAEPVAVTLERGPDQVVAVLGILAAGASYVPVGVDQPPDRRRRICDRAGARLVVAAEDGAVPRRETVPPRPPREPLAGPVPLDPASLAYTIFTSGSTGEPKGVEIAHRAAANTVDDLAERFGVGPGDRVLGVSSLDFDLSVYDVFGLLAVGGAVVLVAEEDRREARSWAALVHRWRVTVWNSVPALLEMLLLAAHPADLASLRLVLVSGDWVGLDLPGRLTRAVEGARFVALGGATEASIWSNAMEVGEVPPHWRSVPYGLPLRNQRYRVVDGRGRDCPDWVPGELHIGGAGVALGYRNDLEATARAFVAHAGQRWYRTGDLGRYWPDGTLEFLGRRDLQVKVRGHRIELGEIEAHAEGHEHVARAVAFTVGEGAAGALALALVPVPAASPDGLGAAVRELLAARLPAYMIPDRVVVGPLPLSANGKVDRRRLGGLAENAGRGAAAPATAQLPVTATEGLVAQLWAELLEVDTVGRDESFFTLGGDSLLATRLTERLHRLTGVLVPLRRLFAEPTVTGLAALVDAARDRRDGDEEGVL
jgi:amino acid adenylation domain-containing protein